MSTATTDATRLPSPTGPCFEPGVLPGDFYSYFNLLSDNERETIASLREFLRAEVSPIVDDYWARAEFPFELVPGFEKLGLVAWADPDSAEEKPSSLLSGWSAMELAHADASIATFFGVHSGLAIGTIFGLGDDEQRRRWLPAMARMKQIGAFALTEPHGGSDVAGGLETTARRDGDEWVLNGAKRWIGNATSPISSSCGPATSRATTCSGSSWRRGRPGFRRARSRTRSRCGSSRTPTSRSRIAG